MQNPVLASSGPEIAENAYGLFIQNLLGDSGGFLACGRCEAMLADGSQAVEKLGLKPYLAQAGGSGVDAVLVVAGSAWERRNGRWPSCIAEDLRRKRDLAKDRTTAKGGDSTGDRAGSSPPVKKWWQFWK